MVVFGNIDNALKYLLTSNMNLVCCVKPLLSVEC